MERSPTGIPQNPPALQRDLFDPQQASRSRFSLSALRSSRKACVKQTSPFLTGLPTEIRTQIYTEALGGSLFHILPTARGIGHMRCPGVYGPGYRCWRNPQSLDPYYYNRPTQNHRFPSKTNTGFLRTCRQIYLEGIDIYYATNTFDFAHSATF
jgi:hypothetical protein